MPLSDYLDELFSDSGEGILLLDADWEIVWVNAAAATFFDSVAGELTGDNFRTVLQQSPCCFDQPEELALALGQAAQKTAPLSLPCRIRPGEHRPERWLDLQVRRLDAGHQAGQLLLRFSDRTPLRRLEAALEESERNCLRQARRFETLLDHIPDGILYLAADCTILWANRTVIEKVPGGADCFGSYCFATFSGRTKPCEGCPVVESLRSGEETIGLINTAGDRTLEVRVFPVPVEAEGSRNLLVHKRDITESLRLREKTVQAAHLATMGELAAGVAHEINNPATAIINCAQLLHDFLDDPEREIALRVLREGERICAIVRNLLCLARPEPGKTPGVKIEEELADILSLSRAQMRRERIILNLRLSDDLPAITVNRQQIRQVFLNIINNARYALNQKYPGFSEEKVLEIRGERRAEGVGVRFTFQDYGTGIPAGILERVFLPFFTTKPVGKGTGLGLSLSHSIIADHSGSLDITSIEGEFTRVIIDLPII